MENSQKSTKSTLHTETPVAPEKSLDAVTQEVVARPSPELGVERMIFTPLLLGILTLGIYELVWLYKIHNEMLNHTGDVNIKPGMAIGLLFIPVVNLFWAIYLVFHVPGLIKQMELQDNIPMEEQTNAGMIGVIGIIPFLGTLLWAALVQNALNRHWRSQANA